ncbi:Aspergilloglutamic peptidase [Coniophora puteana RWD-64-598 SS2]|uniref:Aspergilloglutamic peptidase n=1 Tax=Coniophora puteana (strain RWD-64-598) TaxID=741705 RepID=A0A5M3N990_CONPW|nr:Aspergilloglutamic peptidase [Coniophora puteana RWD-64-598 SS2]EIW87335.1 Aspergilloglutamic peptidase [Coniophora puteana RWD-64-598 SS2]
MWVGIDGVDCCVILQTGVDATINNNQVSYSAWYEWFPDPSHTFDSIDFAAGDDVTLATTAHSTTNVTVMIENKTKNQNVTHEVSSSHALCQKDAEWIVEDYSSGGDTVKFDDFGTVTFTGAQATTGSGTVRADGATIYGIKDQSGKVLTQSSVSNGNVVIKHT